MLSRFLQGPSSNLKIDEEAVLHQHCVASVTCLLSSLRLLHDDYHESHRLIIKGIYGLQLYASEYWTESLLSVLELRGDLGTFPALHTSLCQLTEAIDSWPAFHRNQDKDDEIGQSLQDSRLNWLRDHEAVQRHVRRAIWARSPKQLERHLILENSTCELTVYLLTRMKI